MRLTDIVVGAAASLVGAVGNTWASRWPGSSPILGPGAKRAAARLAVTAKAETARLAGVTEPDMPSRQVMRRTMRKAVKRRIAEEKHAAIWA